MYGTLAAIESVCATHTIEPDEALKAWRGGLELNADAAQVKIMWGSYDPNGYWQPNPKLKMSSDEQWRQNKVAGFSYG